VFISCDDRCVHELKSPAVSVFDNGKSVAFLRHKACATFTVITHCVGKYIVKKRVLSFRALLILGFQFIPFNIQFFITFRKIIVNLTYFIGEEKTDDIW
jgi:hypothetical protein